MGTSAFDLVIVPVLIGTLWALAAGAAYLTLLSVVNAVSDLLGRAIRLSRTSHRLDRDSRDHRPRHVVRRAGSIW